MILEEDNDSLFPHCVTWKYQSSFLLAEANEKLPAMAILMELRRRKDLQADMADWLKEHDIVHSARYDQWKVNFVQLTDAVQFHMAFAERAPSL